MLTTKTLNKKIKEIEEKLISPVKEVNFIARTYLFTNDDDYEKEKENLIKRGFQLVKTEETNTLLYYVWGKYGNKETWEKEYGHGEF